MLTRFIGRALRVRRSTWPWKEKDASRRDDTSILGARQLPKLNVDLVQWCIPGSAGKTSIMGNSSSWKSKILLQGIRSLTVILLNCLVQWGLYFMVPIFTGPDCPSEILKAWTQPLNHPALTAKHRATPQRLIYPSPAPAADRAAFSENETPKKEHRGRKDLRYRV